VVDDLDVVAVGIEDDGCVVTGAVVALARTALVAVAGVDRGAVELVDEPVLVRGEGDVDVLGRRPADDGKRVRLADQLRALWTARP
jgi:hypothetical protein